MTILENLGVTIPSSEMIGCIKFTAFLRLMEYILEKESKVTEDMLMGALRHNF